jgi:hypothetical protein
MLEEEVEMVRLPCTSKYTISFPDLLYIPVDLGNGKGRAQLMVCPKRQLVMDEITAPLFLVHVKYI